MMSKITHIGISLELEASPEDVAFSNVGRTIVHSYFLPTCAFLFRDSTVS